MKDEFTCFGNVRRSRWRGCEGVESSGEIVGKKWLPGIISGGRYEDIGGGESGTTIGALKAAGGCGGGKLGAIGANSKILEINWFQDPN